MARLSLTASNVALLAGNDQTFAGLLAVPDPLATATDAYNTLSSINVSGLTTAQLAGVTSAISSTSSLVSLLGANAVVTIDTAEVSSVSKARAVFNAVMQNLLGRSLTP